MKNKLIRDTVSDTAASVVRVTSREVSDPMTVRKKFSMRDSYFRKNSPNDELLSYELAFDVEFCFWVLLALGFGLIILKKARDNARVRARVRTIEKKKLKRRHFKEEKQK